MIRTTAHHRGLTLVELLALVAATGALLGCLAVGLGAVRQDAGLTMSMRNLQALAVSHVIYSSEWNGRQWTTCPDNLGEIIKEHAGGEYQQSYDALAEFIPAVPLGFDRNGRHFDTSQGYMIQPFYAAGNCSLGSFRAWNTKPFNQYLNAKAYDPTFWAPDDYTMPKTVLEHFKDPGQWPAGGTELILPTYCMAVSAMFHADVFRAESKGGFHDPRDVKEGFRAPSLAQARYPDLKTHMLEHLWLRDRPSDAMPGTDGVPWFFNMGAASRPAAMFYDGHIAVLPVRSVLDSNARIVANGGDPLWITAERSCFSGGGYFDQFALDPDERTSFHVFTADGIRGRDVVQGH